MYCGVPSSAASCVCTVCEPRIFEMPKSSTLTTSTHLAAESVGHEEDVVRLEVAVDDAFAVRGRQRRADLADDRHRLLERQRPAHAAAAPATRPARYSSTRYGVPSGSVLKSQHLDDVRVAEARCDLRLAPEARQHRRVGRAEQQHLDRHALARQPQVLRRPHGAHPALSEQPRDLVRLGDDDAGPQARWLTAGGGRLAARRHRAGTSVGLGRNRRVQGRIQRASRHSGTPL